MCPSTSPVGHDPSENERRLQSATVFVDRDSPDLRTFYLSLDSEQRRQRFGVALSDEDVSDHCEALAASAGFVVAFETGETIEAVAEVQPGPSGWRQAEIAVSCPLHPDRLQRLAHVLQVAAFWAGQLGCRQIATRVHRPDPLFSTLLRSLGPSDAVPGAIRVDISEYAVAAA